MNAIIYAIYFCKTKSLLFTILRTLSCFMQEISVKHPRVVHRCIDSFTKRGEHYIDGTAVRFLSETSFCG